jgi:hypothetical protein
MSIPLFGKQYVTVSERVNAVHASGKTFEILASEPLQAGDRWVWRVTVKIDGLEYRGSAEVHLNAKPGSADATDPWACAETSAVGRALGFCGYGAIESIASADEIVRSEPQSRHNGRQDGIMLGQSHDLADRLKAVTERARALGVATTNEQWQALLRYLEISKVRGTVEIDLIESYLSGIEEKQKEAAGTSGK